MAKNLSKKLGDMEYDGLITGLDPAIVVGAGNLKRATGTATVLKRGTLLAKESDNTLIPMESTKSADCILCEDTEVGTTAEVTACVYMAGCFDPNKLITKDSYKIVEADIDLLRTKGIILKAASK